MSEHLKNGEFYAKGNKIFRAPIVTKVEGGGSRISVGFPVGHVSDYVEPADVVACLNASRHHEALVKALEEIAELGDVRADEAGMVARRALDLVGSPKQ